MKPVLILTRNCLELTKRCVESVRAQDVPTIPIIFDNGSTDGTCEWVITEGIDHTCVVENAGVSAGWNYSLRLLFTLLETGYPHVLVLNNDTMLPPHFYRTLLAYNLPFVTGASVETIESIERRGPFSQAYPGPDFSAFLIRRDCWEKVGPFDERFVHYCGDCDYHVRAHRAGIELLNSGVPFYHERSSTLKNASAEDRQAIQVQADLDRAEFKKKWGCMPWEPKYADLFKP